MSSVVGLLSGGFNEVLMQDSVTYCAKEVDEAGYDKEIRRLLFSSFSDGRHYLFPLSQPPDKSGKSSHRVQ